MSHLNPPVSAELTGHMDSSELVLRRAPDAWKTAMKMLIALAIVLVVMDGLFSLSTGRPLDYGSFWKYLTIPFMVAAIQYWPLIRLNELGLVIGRVPLRRTVRWDAVHHYRCECLVETSGDSAEPGPAYKLTFFNQHQIETGRVKLSVGTTAEREAALAYIKSKLGEPA